MTNLITIKETLHQLKQEFDDYGIQRIGIFGSYIKGQYNAESDVDLLIDLSRPVRVGYLELINLENQISEKLNTPVDLVVQSSLKPDMQSEILSEVQFL